jgi:hypothetical protein
MFKEFMGFDDEKLRSLKDIFENLHFKEVLGIEQP